MTESNRASHGTPACQLCGAEGESLVPWPQGGGEMRYCGACDFVFAWPVPPFDAVDLYSRAYMGQENRADMDQYRSRLASRSQALRHEELALRSPVQLRALEWLEATVPMGATVLEIGCGIGGFMQLLRTRGYHAVGIDVAEPVVKALEDDGFEMWCGDATDAPKDWPQPTPSALACVLILHHLPDPVAFLSAVRERWSVPLVLAQTTHTALQTRIEARPSHYPPRALSWWSKRSIDLALTAAGYSIREITQEPRSITPGLPPEARKRISAALWRWPRARVAVIRGLRAASRIPFVRREQVEELLIIASPT